LFGAVLLVAVRWAVLATAVLVTVCLMAPVVQFGTVEANPYTFSPGVHVSSPASDGVYWKSDVAIDFKIILDEDLAQIDSFFYTLDNQDSSPLTFSRGTEDHHVNYDEYNPNWETYTVSTITVHKTLKNLTDGVHRISVFARYYDGTIKSILYRKLTVDTTLAIPFTPVVISPVDQTIYNTEDVPLTYTIGEEILWSYYSVDSSNASDLKYFEGNITLSSLSEGQHKLSLYLVTTTGPTSEQPYSTGQKIIFYVDTAAPKVSNISVSNVDSGDRMLNFTVDSEASWVGYSLDNQATVTVNGDIILNNLSTGSHNVTFYTEDAAGNTGASEIFFFTIEEPFPTTMVIAPIASAAVIGVGLLVYFKKHKH
jgi:hypothetical protein